MVSRRLMPAVQPARLAALSAGSTRFKDGFDRGDGAPGNGWYSPGGGALAIASNALVVTPVQGAELLVNGDLSAWTDDDPDGWTVSGESGSDPEISEVATGEAHADAPTPGGGCANIYCTTTTVSMAQTVLSMHHWYHSHIIVSRVVFGILGLQFTWPARYLLAAAGAHDVTGRAAGSTFSVLRHNAVDGTVDAVSLKAITTLTMFALRQQTSTSAYAQAKITTGAEGLQAGVAHYADADSFVIAYLDRDYNGWRAKLVKCVAGVYTEVGGVNVTYGAGKVLRLSRSDAAYTVHYDGAEVINTTAITDGVFNNAKTWGLFSTHASNAFDDYEWEVN